MLKVKTTQREKKQQQQHSMKKATHLHQVRHQLDMTLKTMKAGFHMNLQKHAES